MMRKYTAKVEGSDEHPNTTSAETPLAVCNPRRVAKLTFRHKLDLVVNQDGDQADHTKAYIHREVLSVTNHHKAFCHDTCNRKHFTLATSLQEPNNTTRTHLTATVS